jgi:hypothetical protein
MQNPKPSCDSGKRATLIQNPKSKIQNRHKMAREAQGETILAGIYGGENEENQATRLSKGKPPFSSRLDLVVAREKQYGLACSTLTQPGAGGRNAAPISSRLGDIQSGFQLGH